VFVWLGEWADWGGTDGALPLGAGLAMCLWGRMGKHACMQTAMRRGRTCVALACRVPRSGTSRAVALLRPL